MWSQEEKRIAILEIYHSGQLPRRQSQGEAWRWLAELRWTGIRDVAMSYQ